MPPATKRRKVATTITRPLTAPAAQRGIQSFGKISKSQVRDVEKRVSGKSSTAAHSKDGSRSETSKKRKFGSICTPTVKEGVEKASSLGEQAPTIDDGSSKLSDTTNDSQKATPTRTNNLPKNAPLNVETPTKGTRSFLESLALASSSPSDPSSSSHTTDHETPPSSPASAESESPQHHESHQLPDELQDLVNLHSSFLTALSLHYAHNGSRTPADLRNLGPGIERAWRKRRMTLDDVRRILAIGGVKGAAGHEIAGTLYLSDYGYGKICVEIADIPDSTTNKRRPINEEVLNSVFLRDLEQRWMCYKNANPTDPSPSNFLASLALSPITPCTSLSKIAPLLSKGQRRLEDLKAGAIKAQQKPLSITSANPNSIPQSGTKRTSARSTDLFSRLKAKQVHQSTLPLPPSAEALARKSALQRLHEITPVLQSLVVSSEKHSNDDAAAVGVTSVASPVSFTMPTLVQHLQMSLRNPIGKEEVIRSIRMLAEVASEWVVLKEVGKMHGVTIKGAGLRRDELGKRIESLLGKL
ncbi:hypothetical protein IMSHALPRED_010984 [Imshaugia aleurites]|uniref:DNA replication factor Cdt1 C-terminal domain-containing protein n=1 Tax=Imshaugia aleurites TaxID=172621 RepID=A0A8H3IQW6_9LECA|nr:hypothetical protein IMSHALPRED_010984 [Imshaugia aleurites]